MGHNTQMEQEANRPKWLLELENRKRKPRLAHEVGAGSPCIKCTVSCPGLDLHFWRKICKNCKCSRDDHDVPDEDFPQFDLLFGPSGAPKKKSIILKRKSNEETYEWAPPDASKELAIDYMKALPEDKLPIKGTAGAALRKQQLQKQLPLHDIDHKVCDELTDSERKQFEKYLENLKKYVGQGRVSKFTTARPFDRAMMTPANASECFSPKHKPSPILGNSPNLRTPSSFVQKKSHLSRDKSPTDPILASTKREFLVNPPFDKFSSESSKLGQYQISGNISRIPQDETTAVPLGAPGSHSTPGNLISKDFCPSDPILTSSKREFLSNPSADQFFSEASRQGTPHQMSRDIKNEFPQTPAVSGADNPGINLSNGIRRDISNPPVPPELPGCYALNSTGQPEILKDSMNTALHFAQSNLYPEHPGTISNTLPCYPQYQRTGGVKLDHVVNDNKPLRSHQWAKKLEKPINSHDDNSILAEQMLSEALLPPSSINSNDIIASTLDEKGLSYIREKLSSKYGDKEESDIQSQIPMRSRDFEGGPGTRDVRITDNTRPVASQLLSYGGINPNVIHSVNQQNPVFPEAAVGTVRTMEHPGVNRLTSAVENMTIYPIKQKCQQCAEDIVLGDVIVTAEQAKDAAWHPGCFVCSACDELLVDLVYFYHKGKLYCGRDFAALLEIPRCFACDELIFVREYTIAEGHNYHVKHFCCWDCDEPLAGKQYISESDRPLCLPCYQKTYAKTCSACNRVIAADQQGVNVKNLDFHASEECFCCANCKKSLLNGRMAIKENKPFCSKECITTFLNKI
ncbi:uncharacterized protein Tes [Fopius arisanus]|uniref:PRICKLE2 protein n=1 Tax=Fopius arisanus TaxID=64838 RepID=A0A0C9QIM5_9HYME|nr:PREDICTED: uncharacterized protein LOC105269187 [Fopius arisanus]